jgi:hypothetical protein
MIYFQPSYWCGSKVEDSGYENNGDGSVNSEHFERDPQGSKVGISIRHLRKVIVNIKMVFILVKILHEYYLDNYSHEYLNFPSECKFVLNLTVLSILYM